MKTTSFIEPLESRIAPATLINPTTVTYQDVDGDDVTVKVSKPIFTDAATADLILKFDVGDVMSGDNMTKQQLQSVAFAAQGATLTITAKRSANGGDGFVNVGAVGSNTDLKSVTVRGDLGKIGVGDNDPDTPALGSLTVQSMGRFGLSTQANGGDLASFIGGSLGSLKVASDMVGASIRLAGDNMVKLGSVTIGGSLFGAGLDFGGRIQSDGSIGMVKIMGDVDSGTGLSAGAIAADGPGGIAGVTIGGSLIGGPKDNSGAISSLGPVGPIKIHGDVIGGGGMASGQIVAVNSPIASITIDGSLLGGAGKNSGQIFDAGVGSNLGKVKIGGDVIGKGENSGYIFGGVSIGNLSIGGSLVGGDGPSSGSIFTAGDLGKITIVGDVIGGTSAAADFSGRIAANDEIGTVKIGGDLIGGGGEGSGSVRGIIGGHTVQSVQIDGSIIGGTGVDSGEVRGATLGKVMIGRDVLGGLGDSTGLIISTAGITSVKIGGSLKGVVDNSDDFTQSGEIFSDGPIGSIVINGNLVGGSASGVVLTDSGDIQTPNLGSLFIGGSIIAGTETNAGTLSGSGAIRIAGPLGAVTVKGSIVGNDTERVQISAIGNIKSLTVGGRVERADILAGYGSNAVASNVDAQMGAIKVGGDWIASSAAAGIDPGNGKYGDGDDVKTGVGTDDMDIFSRIASIEIKGQALGTVGGSDHFGFVAQEIGSFKVGGTAFPLVAGEASPADIAGYAVGATGDLRVREVAL